MSTVTIDGKEYATGTLSAKAKSQLRSIQLIDQKLAELQRDLVVYQVAERAYAASLSEQLPDKEAHANKKKDVVEISGKRYALESFSESARAELESLLATSSRIAGAKQEIAIVQTSRNVHATALKSELPQ